MVSSLFQGAFLLEDLADVIFTSSSIINHSLTTRKNEQKF